MAYDEDGNIQVEFADRERLDPLLAIIGERLHELRGLLGDLRPEPKPTSADWSLESGEIGVFVTPSTSPQVLCVIENPDTGHWMLQLGPCGTGIFIYDLTTGTSTI